MIIRVLDFETTGFPPNASVCEAAFVDVNLEERTVSKGWQSLVIPTTEMGLEALAIHHITLEEAQGGVTWEAAQAKLKEGEPAFCAHNAAFEQKFFRPLGSQWIDTYKVALKLWPESPRHTNQILRYFLGLDLDERAVPPHRALPDAWVTAHILLEAAKLASVEELIEWSGSAGLPTIMPFGKHKGKEFSKVPKDYLRWMVDQDKMKSEVKAAARRALG